MERRTGDPTHVIATRRIDRQLQTWDAEHPSWHVELQKPITDDPWSFVMTYHYDDDPPGKLWYTRYRLEKLVPWMGDPIVSGLAVLHVVNGILLEMQREIGAMHSGAHTPT